MTSLAEVATGDPDEGSGFVVGLYKLGAEVERRTRVCYYCKSPDHLIRDCALFETAQEALNLRGGVEQKGNRPPPQRRAHRGSQSRPPTTAVPQTLQILPPLRSEAREEEEKTKSLPTTGYSVLELCIRSRPWGVGNCPRSVNPMVRDREHFSNNRGWGESLGPAGYWMSNQHYHTSTSGSSRFGSVADC